VTSLPFRRLLVAAGAAVLIASFLKRYPVPYPHFADPGGDVARVFRGGRAFPTTAFYAADRTLAFTRLGGYATEAKPDADIKRYALDG